MRACDAPTRQTRGAAAVAFGASANAPRSSTAPQRYLKMPGLRAKKEGRRGPTRGAKRPRPWAASTSAAGTPSQVSRAQVAWPQSWYLRPGSRGAARGYIADAPRADLCGNQNVQDTFTMVQFERIRSERSVPDFRRS